MSTWRAIMTLSAAQAAYRIVLPEKDISMNSTTSYPHTNIKPVVSRRDGRWTLDVGMGFIDRVGQLGKG